MKKTIAIISEEFEHENTGETVEGITIMVDGILKEFIDVIKNKNSEYRSNTDLIEDALMKGLQKITEENSE